MKLLIPIIVAVVLCGGLALLRRPGTGGAVGRAVRDSDWHAWRDAVEDKRRELDELLEQEPKR